MNAVIELSMVIYIPHNHSPMDEIKITQCHYTTDAARLLYDINGDTGMRKTEMLLQYDGEWTEISESGADNISSD